MLNHRRLLGEMFLRESSFSRAIPADDSDLTGPVFSTQNGQIPLEDLHPVGNGGYVLWDNGMYVEVFVHISPGNWETVENESQYMQLPQEVRAAYEKMTGSQWPGPGNSLKRIIRPGQNRGPTN